MARGSRGWWRAGLGNYRCWLLALAYGCCFGVELTVDNVLALYLFDQFALSLTAAGTIGAWGRGGAWLHMFRNGFAHVVIWL